MFDSRVGAVARLPPRHRRLITVVLFWQPQIIRQQPPFKRQFVVGKMAEQMRIIFGRGQWAGVFITKRFKLRIEDKDAIVGITGVPGLRKSAAALSPITRHEIPDAGVI